MIKWKDLYQVKYIVLLWKNVQNVMKYYSFVKWMIWDFVMIVLKKFKIINFYFLLTLRKGLYWVNDYIKINYKKLMKEMFIQDEACLLVYKCFCNDEVYI